MNRRSRSRVLLCALVLGAGLSIGFAVTPAPTVVSAQQAQPADAPDLDTAAVGEGQTAEGEHHGESPWLTVARLLNFGLLVGGLGYFLGPLISRYLSSRSDQIRADLVQAAAMRRTAESQLAEIDNRLKTLPAELEELRRRGSQEIAAEEARIRAVAEADRQRLLEQMHREVELQVRIARRTLMREAAVLAVGVAEQRIRAQITPADHARLLARYTRQLGAA